MLFSVAGMWMLISAHSHFLEIIEMAPYYSVNNVQTIKASNLWDLWDGDWSFNLLVS